MARKRVTTILSDKQKLALVLSRKGLRDHQIAGIMGLRSRESACRLRLRGLNVIKRMVDTYHGKVSVDEVLANLAASVVIPAQPIGLAMAG